MPHVEIATLEKKISETRKAIADTMQFSDSNLRMIMSSELEMRLSTLLEEKSSLERAISKETVSLRIYGDSIQPGKVSSRILLAALSGFQATVDSVANAMFHSPTSRGKIPCKVKDITAFDVIGTFAGSFGLTLQRQNSQYEMSADSSTISRVLDELFAVLETTDNSDMLMSTIAPFGKRTVGHYRQWLDDLQNNDVNLEISWTDSAASKRHMHLIKEKAPSIISTLDAIDKIDHSDIELAGILNGVNVRSHTFEMSVDSIGLVKGIAKPDILMSISDRIGAEVNAHLIKSISFTKAGVQNVSWYLSHID